MSHPRAFALRLAPPRAAHSPHIRTLRSSSAELDPAIVRDALHGSPSAQAQLCACYQRLVFTVSRRVLARHAIPIDTRDLAQEVWSQLLEDGCRRLSTFRAERGAFGRFLRMVVWQQASRIAKTWAGRWNRNLAAQRRWDPSPTTTSPEDDPVEHRLFLARLVKLAEPELDSLDRALLEEIAQGDASARELASVMGYDSAIIYRHRRRLRRRFREVTRCLDAG